MDELFTSIQQDLAGLAGRLAAVEARLAQVAAPAATAADLAPVEPAPQAPQGVTVEELVDCLPNPWKGDFDSFARYLLDHPRIGPLLRGEGATVPAPVVDSERRDLAAALIADAECLEADQPECMLLDSRQYRRAAALLLGEGAPVQSPVMLPEGPPFWRLPYVEGPSDEDALVRAVWAAARAEVARQQGGSDHE